jgi:hypothetical protein
VFAALRGIALAIATCVVLAGGAVVAAPANAAGYPSYAACDRAGRAGVAAGYWSFYHCVPASGGGWNLLPE